MNYIWQGQHKKRINALFPLQSLKAGRMLDRLDQNEEKKKIETEMRKILT